MFHDNHSAARHSHDHNNAYGGDEKESLPFLRLAGKEKEIVIG